MKGRIAGIFLILAITAPIGLTYVGIFWHKAALKQTIKQAFFQSLKPQELTIVKVTFGERSGIQWEGDDEFELDHQMYDVISTKKVADGILYFCWLDKKESLLNQKLKELIDNALGTDAEGRRSKERLAQFLRTLTIDNPFDYKAGLLTRFVVHQFTYSFSSITIYSKPLLPPPWF